MSFLSSFCWTIEIDETRSAVGEKMFRNQLRLPNPTVSQNSINNDNSVNVQVTNKCQVIEFVLTCRPSNVRFIRYVGLCNQPSAMTEPKRGNAPDINLPVENKNRSPSSYRAPGLRIPAALPQFRGQRWEE